MTKNKSLDDTNEKTPEGVDSYSLSLNINILLWSKRHV